jgi:phosphatidylglycerophosphate synthase
MESAGAFEVFSFLDSLALSPVMLVGAFLVLSVGMIAASWVLYRNLITTDAVDGHYARVSLS